MLLALLALPRPAVRRAAVAMTAGASGLLALAIAYGLWRNSAGADAFIQGRLMGSIGYGGGMAAVMAVAVWPLVGFASDRLTALSLRAASAAGAGAALALVIPTGARAAPDRAGRVGARLPGPRPDAASLRGHHPAHRRHHQASAGAT